MTRKFTINNSQLPIIIIAHSGEALDAQAARAIATRLGEMLDRREPWALLFNGLNEKKPPATAQRDFIGAFLKQRKAEFTEHCKGMAFIFDSILQRMALRGVFLVAKLPTEIKVFATEKEGSDWIRARMPLDTKPLTSTMKM